jgi:hypothetical protein
MNNNWNRLPKSGVIYSTKAIATERAGNNVNMPTLLAVSQATFAEK